MASHLLSPSLVQLAALLGEVLGGPVAASTVLSRELGALASRHQVAPLLYAVASNGRHPAPKEVLEGLQESYRASVARRQATLPVLDRIADHFQRRGVAWTVFKGTTQAAQFYPDPAWRSSADIDLLVPPADFGHALDVLVEIGFVASYPPVPRRGIFRHMILAAVRDVMLVVPANTADSIELHKRLFFAGGRHPDNLVLPVGAGRMPMPVPGPDLAFYLIAHGALSYWARLKWLVDLVPLLGRLQTDELAAIRECARSARSENAVAASLLLLRALFPFVALGPLEAWLEEKRSDRAVQRRFRRYAEALGSDDGKRKSPLNDAWAMLEAAMLLFEAPSTRLRILITAPFSSAMRRLAGLIYHKERALTLS
ncbi:MAG TPA: nucleotidyltransferase family protein [Rhizomicrobium sp.]|jgi:hypothetical protein